MLETGDHPHRWIEQQPANRVGGLRAGKGERGGIVRAAKCVVPRTTVENDELERGEEAGIVGFFTYRADKLGGCVAAPMGEDMEEGRGRIVGREDTPDGCAGWGQSATDRLKGANGDIREISSDEKNVGTREPSLIFSRVFGDSANGCASQPCA